MLSVKPSVNKDGQNRYRHVDGQCTLGAPSRAAGGGEDDDRRYDDSEAMGERSFVFLGSGEDAGIQPGEMDGLGDHLACNR